VHSGVHDERRLRAADVRHLDGVLPVRRLVAVLLVAGCAHAPSGSATDADAGTPPSSRVLPGQLVVGTAAPSTPEEVLAAVATDGYRFEYVAASSASSHLVRVTKADGSALTEEETEALRQQLASRANLGYVELNRLRQPR
jgi:uncharacterized lipoprotein YajG